MKKLTLYLLAFCLAYSYSSALTQLGNGALLLDGRANFAYDSNVFINPDNEQDDFQGLVYGGLRFLQRERSILNADLSMGVEMTRFMDFTEENAEDFKSSFSVSYPNNVDRPGYFSISGGFNEDTRANDDVGQRIETDSFDLDALYTHQLSNKLGIELDAGFSNRKYSSILDPDAEFILDRDSDITNYGVLAAFNYSEKLAGVFRVQLRELDYSGANTVQQDSVVYAIGLRGELGPTLAGGISVGSQEFDLTSPATGTSSLSDFFYSVNLTWAPRSKTRVTISGDSQFQSSASGDVNNRESIIIRLEERLSDKVTVNAGLVFGTDNYQGGVDRKADFMLYTAGANYTLTNYTSLNFSVNFTDRNADFQLSDYTRFNSSIGITTVW